MNWYPIEIQVKDDHDKYNILEQNYGKNTMSIIKQFRKLYPGMDILYALSVDTLFRPQTTAFPGSNDPSLQKQNATII